MGVVEGAGMGWVGGLFRNAYNRIGEYTAGDSTSVRLNRLMRNLWETLGELLFRVPKASAKVNG